MCKSMPCSLPIGMLSKFIYKNISAPIRFINQPPGAIVDETSVQTVQLRLSGKRAKVNTLGEGDIHIQLNLQNLTQGEHTLRLTDKNVDLPIGIKINRVIPTVIKFHLSPAIIDRETH